MDPQSWQCIMDKVYVEWSPAKMRNGEKCHVHSDYEHTPANLAASLAACHVIGYDEENEFETRFRSRMFQPTLYKDHKPMWMYYGGQKQKKYVVFGCIVCHRATTVSYNEAKAKDVLMWYFPDPKK